MHENAIEIRFIGEFPLYTNIAITVPVRGMWRVLRRNGTWIDGRAAHAEAGQSTINQLSMALFMDMVHFLISPHSQDSFQAGLILHIHLLHEILNHLIHAARALIDLYLAIGAGAPFVLQEEA